MLENNPQVNFAQEYVTDSRIKFLALALLLAISLVLNGVLTYKALGYKSDLAQTQQALQQTQKALKDSNDDSDVKTSAALMHGVYNVPMKQALKLAKWEVKYSRKYNIDLKYGLAISAQESRWVAKAVSPNDSSLGIKQVNCHSWCEHFGVTRKDLFNPEKNIELGYRILAENRQRYGSMDKAILAYYGSTSQAENQEYLGYVLMKLRLFDFV